jgi:hypothetical protein
VTRVADAAGDLTAAPGKLVRLVRVLAAYGDGRELDRRLASLRRSGVIDEIPTRVQLAVGSIDMLRFFISPAAADYYRRMNIHYGVHQLLRVLDEPASMADPVGFFSERDGVIGHLMQVVHANPIYDLQLLEMWDDGLDALEAQLAEMLAGTHARARSIGAIVEEPDYHARLLSFVRAWRQDRSTPPMLRANLAESDGRFDTAQRTFGTLSQAMRYFARLPRTVPAALAHLAVVRKL